MNPKPTNSISKKASLLVLATICGLFLLFQNCGGSFTKFPDPSLNQSSQTGQLKTCGSSESSASRLQDTCYESFDEKYYANFGTYEPQYPLFTDGADKKRWIYVPMNSKIDSSDPDNWIFPVGTILWKEFILEGKKIETRMMEKVNSGQGASAWQPSVYLWTRDQSEAVKITLGVTPADGRQYAVDDLSFNYKVPAQDQCMNCHQGASDVVLGFDYLQLSDLSKPGNLSRWKQSDLFKNPPLEIAEIPGNELDKQVVGYIHGNCAGCHSDNGTASNKIPRFKFTSAASELENQPLLSSIDPNTHIIPGDCANSLIFQRLDNGTMPPFGTLSDDTAIAQICDWIDSLNPE